TLTNLVAGQCTSGSKCNMDYGNGNPLTNQFTFTYVTPGIYKLIVVYQGGISDDIMVTVDPNVTPAFDIFTCNGSKVSINITDRTYDLYEIDFNGDGVVDTRIPSSSNQVATFNYGAPGNYNLSVQGKKVNAANNCNANTQPFVALAVLPVPSISTLTAVDAATLQLGFTPQSNIEYHAEIAFGNATNFQQYQALYKVNSLTVPNLTVDSKYYCFRLSSFDPCANANVYSSPVCSHDFSLTIASGVNHLNWQTSSLGVSSIQLTRTDPNGQSFFGLSATATSYNDNAIVCKTNYCYQLISNYASGATSTSLQKCGTSILTDTPTAITNTSAVVSNNNSHVDLTWIQDPAYTVSGYSVLRSQSAGPYALQGTVTSTQFTDTAYPSGSCYKINYTDKCDNASAEGLPSCPILLTGFVDGKNDVHLQWSPYSGWNLGVKEYTVEKYDQQGQLLQTLNLGTATAHIDSVADVNHQVVVYKITALANEAGVSVSVSNEIRIVKGVNLWYPTAFNPDSKMSSLNRTFTVRGHFIATLQLQVFDRWGALVFYTDKNEPWDGRREGTSMPDATYVWTAQGTDINGNAFKKAGTIVLLRK
ncbi:MAG TPA: gliding motility-associated C-terminal domain-containing protein, partial [Cyclobacteriaceae bacterium]|nr:gliding motility-associated C-terminal domain-containing protein [Cyclobacteriaceae bacterium]